MATIYRFIITYLKSQQNNQNQPSKTSINQFLEKSINRGSITFRVDDFARKLKALKERHKLAQGVNPG